MSETENQPPGLEDDLEISPETVEDLDADEAGESQVRGGGTTGAGCP